MKLYNYLSVLLFANTAFSATVFTDRAAFNIAAARLGAIVTDGYESYPVAFLVGAQTLSLSRFNVSYVPGTGGSSDFGIQNVEDPSLGFGPTAGTNYIAAIFGAPTASMTFLFATPIIAFGTDIKDLEVANLTYISSTGATGIAAVPAANGVVQFFGIVGDGPFTSVAFTGTSVGSDGVFFDQTSFVVPEPSTLILTALGAAIGLRSRRRKSRTSQILTEPRPSGSDAMTKN